MLAVLALITVATSGALQSVLIVAALVPAIWAVGLPRSASSERSKRSPAPLYVVLAPVFVGVTIAYAVASDEWFAFAAIAIVFPLAVIWRQVYTRWQDGRVGPNIA